MTNCLAPNKFALFTDLLIRDPVSDFLPDLAPCLRMIAFLFAGCALILLVSTTIYWAKKKNTDPDFPDRLNRCIAGTLVLIMLSIGAFACSMVL